MIYRKFTDVQHLSGSNGEWIIEGNDLRIRRKHPERRVL